MTEKKMSASIPAKFYFSNSILEKYEFAKDIRSLTNLYIYIG